MLAAMGVFEAPAQERASSRRSTARAVLAACEDEGERVVLATLLAGESFDEGAAMLYADMEIRLAFELGSEDAARSLAKSVLQMAAADTAAE
jgi:hypothetical protein